MIRHSSYCTCKLDISDAQLTDFWARWVRLVLKGTNRFFFSDQIQYILAHRARIGWIWSLKKCPDLSHLEQIWPTFGPNLKSLDQTRNVEEIRQDVTRSMASHLMPSCGRKIKVEVTRLAGHMTTLSCQRIRGSNVNRFFCYKQRID